MLSPWIVRRKSNDIPGGRRGKTVSDHLMVTMVDESVYRFSFNKKLFASSLLRREVLWEW